MLEEHKGKCVRTKAVGLSLVLVAGLAFTVQAPADAGPAPTKGTGEPQLATPSDALPNVAEEKQRALRQVA